jgi:hypothetical protein
MQNRRISIGECPSLDGGARSAEHEGRLTGASAKGQTAATNVRDKEIGAKPQNIAKS